MKLLADSTRLLHSKKVCRWPICGLIFKSIITHGYQDMLQHYAEAFRSWITLSQFWKTVLYSFSLHLKSTSVATKATRLAYLQALQLFQKSSIFHPVYCPKSVLSVLFVEWQVGQVNLSLWVHHLKRVRCNTHRSSNKLLWTLLCTRIASKNVRALPNLHSFPTTFLAGFP